MNPLRQIKGPGNSAATIPAITTKTGEGNPAWKEPVSFPEWN
jgi:hypothetical protein